MVFPTSSPSCTSSPSARSSASRSPPALAAAARGWCDIHVAEVDGERIRRRHAGEPDHDILAGLEHVTRRDSAEHPLNHGQYPMHLREAISEFGVAAPVTNRTVGHPGQSRSGRRCCLTRSSPTAPFEPHHASTSASSRLRESIAFRSWCSLR